MPNRSERRGAAEIPAQCALPAQVIFRVAWAGMRRRFSRSLVSVSCVVLAIAFVSYMLLVGDITDALVKARDSELNILLQQKGVDIYAASQTDTMTLLLLGLALLTCTVGIVNTMLMSVTERVREIGTLKCLGARDMFIVKTYFVEATLQGLAGALIGMVVGAVVAVLIAAVDYPGHVLAHLPLARMLRSQAAAFVCGLLISVIAAIAPAYLAARKQPVEALRVEE